MKFSKWLFLISLAALLVLGTGAVLAQDNGTPPPHWTGNSTHTPQGDTSGTDPTPTPDPHHNQWSNGDHHDWQHRHDWQGYTYTAPLTCTLATQLEGQTQAEVAQTYSSLRAAIGSSDVLAVMPHGAIVSILSGPDCSGGTYWYEVSYNGMTGWVTEGGAGEYWLEPVAS